MSIETHDEFGVQWDGDPKMGGGFHVCSIGTTWRTEKEAREAIGVLQARNHHSNGRGMRPGLRIVTRLVSEWETVD